MSSQSDMPSANIENMLFKYGTTYKTDFRSGKILNQVLTTYQKKPTCMRLRPPPLKDVHTMTDWKPGTCIPFNLLHKPKGIVGTSPTAVQKPFNKAMDDEREVVQKSRPRVYMTPACCVDDVKQPVRATLCDDMYTTEAMRAMRIVDLPYLSVKAPLPDLPTQANPLRLHKLEPPMVSPEWRMDSVTWDNKQLRSYCPHTRLFWLKREKPRCEKCDEFAAVLAHRNMQHQMVKKTP